MNDPAPGTSATGARSTFTPASRSAFPDASASARTDAGAEPAELDVVGSGPAHGRRRTVAALLVGRDQQRRAPSVARGALQGRRERRSWAWLTTLAPKRITPPISPCRTRASSAGRATSRSARRRAAGRRAPAAPRARRLPPQPRGRAAGERGAARPRPRRRRLPSGCSRGPRTRCSRPAPSRPRTFRRQRYTAPAKVSHAPARPCS